MGALGNALVAALGPVLRGLAGEEGVGCQIAIYRATTTTSADGSPSRTYAVDPAWSTVDGFFFVGSKNEPGTDALVRGHGVRTTGHGELLFPANEAGTMPTISVFDGFKILTGPFTGYTWLAEADGVTDEIGVATTVRVIAAPVGALP